jgi:endonuclease YncB( thermonuclease family)
MRLSAVRVGLVAVLVLAASAAFPQGQQIIGIPSVIDGDTIEIHGKRIRLFGIDAPEDGQQCSRPDGNRWRCGQHAALALQDHIGRRPVTCEQCDIDRYGRIVARCTLAGEDMNAWLVANGWAAAYTRYSRDYVRDEAEARAARRGIWSGDFVVPWEWRRGMRLHQ